MELAPQVWGQVGIVSWGDSCAAQGSPGIYYRTTDVAQWIHFVANVENSIWCARPQR